MRVQLKIIHLLLIGPIFLVVVAVLANSRLPYYYWSLASQEVNRLESRIQVLYEVDSPDEEISQAAIGSWLDGSMGNNHRLKPILGESPGKDPWGNPYRFVTRSVGGEDRLGVYSLGRDRTSKSNGDDADDLNSWSKDSLRWYRRVTDRRERVDLAVQGGVITALIYLVFLACTGIAGAGKRSG